jgi:chorismate dehydratase
MAAYRLGSVPYLNAEPLIWPLEKGKIENSHSLIRAAPGELVEKLGKGEVDCALVSVAALFGNPKLVPLPDVAIASRGAVASVILFHDSPLEELETIWLDPASLTSNLLVQILRNPASDKPCKYIIPGKDEDAPSVDALPKNQGRLIIGDSALAHSSERDSNVGTTDLGALWKEKTNHPFVFARWFARNGDIAGDLAPLMREARDWSLLHLHEMVAPLAKKYNFPVSLVDRYLRLNITYMYGPREEAGEREFFRLAKELGERSKAGRDA